MKNRGVVTSSAVVLAVLVLAISMSISIGESPHRIQSARAATGLAWKNYDVTIDLRSTGAYHVTERQVIRFDRGSYSSGYATLPIERIDQILNISVSEQIAGRTVAYDRRRWSSIDGPPHTFATSQNASDIELVWFFDEAFNETRTFTIEYDVVGALRVYGDGAQTTQQIWWTAISKDVTDVAPVESAVVTINLTEPVDPSATMLGQDGEQAAADHTSDGRTWKWSASNLVGGDEFIVRLEFPAIVDASPPAWQAIDDQIRRQQELRDQRKAFYSLVFLAIGLLFSVLGAGGLYGLWYARGRDPHVGLVADFLSEPPDDLPPGAVGALIDEVANERDIVATVVDLGRRGILKIAETPDGGRSFGGRDFELELLNPDAPVTEFERSVMTAIFGGMKQGESVRLSSAKAHFGGQAEGIKTRMYAELVARGYFTSSPESTRKRWRGGAKAGVAVLVVAAVIAGAFVTRLSPLIYFPLAIAVATAVALIFLSRVLPRKTLAGAEAAAKWLAFRKYLADLERYDKVSETQQIFDRYLPYAVAFGLEETWVARFSAAGAAPPAWYGPVIVSGPRDWSDTHRSSGGGSHWGGGGWAMPNSGGGYGGPRGGGIEIPDLQDMSDRSARSLQGSSNSFFDMLNSAASAFEGFSSSSGGGHRSSGRSWGGSSGGFRGGGSRGGSSGGGKRGFR